MPKVLYFSYPKGTLTPFGIEVVLSQDSQGNLQMLQMCNQGWNVNQNVIKENQNEFTQIRLKHMVHESLEGGGGICQPKRYH